MANREPSAAAALYGHLPSGARDVAQRQRQPNSVADAMFGHLRPPAPKPQPANRYSEETTLAARCDENPQLEWLMGLCGLKRIR